MSWQRLAVATLLFACVLAPRSGWAEDAAGEAAWAFDVRVVRVDTSAEQVESAPTWPQPVGEVGTAAPWPELLTVLKRRGATRIMMDRSSTTAEGHEARVTHYRERSALAVQTRSDPGGAVQTAFPSREGVEVSVIPTSPPQYQIDVMWIDDRLVRAGEQLPGERATWRGRAPPLDRGTLVLRHAQQFPSVASPLVGTEVYVFLTFRRIVTR
jgi:hypothetical protein